MLGKKAVNWAHLTKSCKSGYPISSKSISVLFSFSTYAFPPIISGKIKG